MRFIEKLYNYYNFTRRPYSVHLDFGALSIIYLLTYLPTCCGISGLDVTSVTYAAQGRGDGPEAGTSGASEAARASCRLGSPEVLRTPSPVNFLKV